MGGTFEEQINDLIVKGKEWADDIINLPAPSPGRTPRGRNNMGSNAMTRPKDAPSSNYYRDPNAPRRTWEEIMALREVLAQERRTYAYQNPGYTGGTIPRGGSGGGGGGGAGAGNGPWTDPKLLWVGGAALVFFLLYRKKKKKD